MKTVLAIAGLGLFLAAVVVVAYLLWNGDGKGCEQGGPGCHCCPFPCEYSRTGEKEEKMRRKYHE